MSQILTGKVAIVTGAGRGIGRCHALALAKAGAAVVANDLGGAMDGSGQGLRPATAVVEEIEASGGQALADGSDVADWDQAGRLVAQTVARYGRLDILINNAGIVRYSTIFDETHDSWQRTLAVNLGGTAAMLHFAARHWRDAGPAAGRSVINTCSPTATNPASGAAAYSASKGAIATLTLTSAMELADLGVRVNALVPVARTRMAEAVSILSDAMRPVATGLDRMAPERIAEAALYLASPLCPLTGRLLGVEGDDIWLYNSFSATNHVHNDGQAWTPTALADALSHVTKTDDGLQFAASTLQPGCKPGSDIFDALDKVAKGVPVKLLPVLHS